MASNFGVHLKPKDGGTRAEIPRAKRTELKTKPVSDLKAIFDKGDGQSCSKAFAEPGSNYSKKTVTSTRTADTQNKNSGMSKTVKSESVTTSFLSKTSKVSDETGLTSEDRRAFDMLKTKIDKTGVQNLDKKDEIKPKVAVAKTYSGGKTFTATVKTKQVNTIGDEEGKKEINKSDAVSLLSFGLTKLRTRPLSLKNEDSLSRSNSVEEESGNPPGSPKSESLNLKPIRPVSPASKDGKREKFLSGVAKGWKAGGEDSSGRNSPNSQSGVKFTDSSVGKIQQETADKSVKVPGFRSVSPLSFTSKNSDDDSSNSSSARSPRASNLTSAKDDSSKRSERTDINENIRKFGGNKNENKPFLKSTSGFLKKTEVNKVEKSASDLNRNAKKSDDSKNKFTAIDKDLPKKGVTKLGKTANSPSREMDKGRSSPKMKNEFKWSESSRSSLELKLPRDKGQHHRPLSRASSSGSNSSITKKDASVVRARIERFASPEPSSDDSKEIIGRASAEFRREEYSQSRRMSADKFLDLKKGFESKAFEDRTKSPAREPKPKLEIKVNKKILERKESFEGGEIFRKKSFEHKEILSPRDRGKVLQTIKSLNELDAKAKASPSIIRRTRSLPSDSLEDENDSSADYYEDLENYNPEAHMHRNGDDASNEGDISSEADLIYEEIPTAVERSEGLARRGDLKDRRATAFRKRKKVTEEPVKQSTGQTGTDGDIDSDSDSSNSGIYEPIDDDNESPPISESDSLTEDIPPELPPLRNQGGKKKKKKDDKGTGTKGFREKFRQLYAGGKGKGVDGEGVPPGAPQSSGIMSKLRNNMKKNKNSNSGTSLDALANSEDIPICDSEGTDNDPDPEVTLRSSGEKGKTGDGSQPPAPPPLPPRLSGTTRMPSGGPDIGNKEYGNVDSGASDYVTPVNSGTVDSKSGRLSPPLPPRNRVSQNVDLNLVIPVAPGGGKMVSPAEQQKGGRPIGKDSYLHGQRLMQKSGSPDIPYMDQTPETTPSPEVPPLPTRPPPTLRTSSTDSYVDVGNVAPPVPQRPVSRNPLSSTDSYVDVGDAPLPDSEYSLADEIRPDLMKGRKELEKRPLSSAYIKPHDLSTVPAARSGAPFEDVMRFRSEYDEDSLYIDLSDDQVYGTFGSRYKSKLESESLYQVYNQEKISRASKRKAMYSSFDESDEEGYVDDEEKDQVYEELSDFSSGRGSLDVDNKSEGDTASQSSKISTLEMFGKKGTVLRTLWAEMPEVKSSGVLDTITPAERKLQESMFEIITSEASYLKSLNVLIDVFLMSEEFGNDHSNKCVLTRQERHVVFSNIGTIRNTSEKFLSDLESRWQKSVILSDICDIITEHATKYFECYVHYCSNQAFQDKSVTDLRKKPEFAEGLKRLESHPECQGLPMISFLLLPMQRITRLPLLIDAICHRMDPIKDKARHKSAINAFTALSKVVKKCNEGAKKMQQTEQMYFISRQIAFAVKEIPLISASRFLVKQGEVTRIISESSGRIFGKGKPEKKNVHLFLFSDILLVTKKKNNQYIVTDYAQRNSLHAENMENPEKNTRLLPLGVPTGCKYPFLMVMLENHQKEQVEAVFACNSTSDRARWVEAVTPVKVTDDQRIYEEWDCPQVQCIQKYMAKEPDELSLEESDVVNVFKKLDDGMYEGERMRDGERGWFPKECTVEIVNSHVRARNLRMKYRLMSAQEGYS